MPANIELRVAYFLQNLLKKENLKENIIIFKKEEFLGKLNVILKFSSPSSIYLYYAYLKNKELIYEHYYPDTGLSVCVLVQNSLEQINNLDETKRTKDKKLRGN